MARSKRSDQRKEQIRQNYARLRQAGFSPLEASRLRTASEYTIEKAVTLGEREPLNERYQKIGKGQSVKVDAFSPYEYHTGRIRNSDYKDVTEGEGKMYKSKYAYLFTYVVTDKKGNNPERKYYTILSDTKRNKSDLIREVYQDALDNHESTGGEYDKKVIKSSIKMVDAYYNPDFD